VCIALLMPTLPQLLPPAAPAGAAMNLCLLRPWALQLSGQRAPVCCVHLLGKQSLPHLRSGKQSLARRHYRLAVVALPQLSRAHLPAAAAAAAAAAVVAAAAVAAAAHALVAAAAAAAAL
jgi:hypothetical protein